MAGRKVANTVSRSGFLVIYCIELFFITNIQA